MKVFVVGCHADDEVIGCGGSIFMHAQAGHDVTVIQVTDSRTSRYTPGEFAALQASYSAVDEKLGIRFRHVEEFKPQTLTESNIPEMAEIIKGHIDFPHGKFIVYTHVPDDLNQDHRMVSLATLVAVRPFTMPSVPIQVLGFEVPNLEVSAMRWDTYIPISAEAAAAKSAAVQLYSTEEKEFPHPWSSPAVHTRTEEVGSRIGIRFAERFRSLLCVQEVGR